MTILKNPSDPIRRWFLGWIPFWAYSALVFESSIVSPEKIPSAIGQFNDKLLHTLVYFLLFWISLNAFIKARRAWLQARAAYGAFVYCLFFGALTEWAQSFTPLRRPEWGDWFADAGAGLAGLVIYMLFIRPRESK